MKKSLLVLLLCVSNSAWSMYFDGFNMHDLPQEDVIGLIQTMQKIDPEAAALFAASLSEGASLEQVMALKTKKIALDEVKVFSRLTGGWDGYMLSLKNGDTITVTNMGDGFYDCMRETKQGTPMTLLPRQEQFEHIAQLYTMYKAQKNNK